MPNSEMMKLITRNGWQFSCGWLPPAGDIDEADSGAGGGSVPYGS